MQNLTEKVVFISGGGSGIGLAMARSFLAAGSRVIIADIDERALEEAAASIKIRSDGVSSIVLDVASPDSWRSARRQVEASMGSIDILCNNAGIGSSRKPLGEMSEGEWAKVFEVNVNGVFNGLRTFLPGMKARADQSHVVNTASILGHFACPNVSEYVASKYAVLGLSETLRMELAGTQVGVSVLCPGLVATRLGQSPAERTQPAPAQRVEMKPKGMEAAKIGDAVVQAVRSGRFYIFTHPEYEALVSRRFQDIHVAIEQTHAIGEPDDVGYLGRGFV